MSTRVLDAGREVRELVNDLRRRDRLMQDKGLWLHVCVCMDVISDAEQAIRGYLAQTTTDHDVLYLTTFGVLQTFVTQQDAVAHLAAALGHPLDGWIVKKERMDWRKHPALLEVREVRIRAAGHPSKTRPVGSGPEEYHSIVQHSLYVGFFEMQSSNAHSHRRAPVDVTRLAAIQREQVGQLLERLRDALIEDDRQHRLAFQGERLSELFSGVGYALEKVIGALGGWDVGAMAEGGVAVLEDALKSFSVRLAERGLALDSVRSIYSELRFPMINIRAALAPGASDEQRQNAYYLARYVEGQLDALKDIASEIDDQYRGADQTPAPEGDTLTATPLQPQEPKQ